MIKIKSGERNGRLDGDGSNHRRLWISVSLGLLFGGIGLGLYFSINRPVAEKKSRLSGAILVEVKPARVVTRRVTVKVMGTVVASRRVKISPRVGGEVVSVSPKLVPGGIFEKGQKFFQVDPEDYEIAADKSRLALASSRLRVEEARNRIILRDSELAKARENFRLEKARCQVAKSEYEMLGEEVAKEDMELVLRKPQLASAEAAVKAADAMVASAKVALETAT